MDALQAGILPVTIENAASPVILDLAYPLVDRTLHWPGDQERISRLMESDALYRETLNTLLAP